MKEGISMLKEFKKFALRGNMIDLAVGIIVGGAFNSIVNSLVNDIVMPLLGDLPRILILVTGSLPWTESTMPH